MRALASFPRLGVLTVVVAASLGFGAGATRGQGGQGRGGAQPRFVPPTGAGAGGVSLGLQTRVTDTGVLVVGHAPNSVGKGAGIERGDTVITVDGQQVGQVGNRLVDLEQAVVNAVTRQGGALILIRNGRDGRLVNVNVNRNQFTRPGPITPPPVTPPPVVPPRGGGGAGEVVQVKKIFLQYLGREASPEEVSGRSAELRQGKPLSQIQNEILASPEYFRRNGNDETKFIGALYRDLLRRNPVPPEGGNWLTRLRELKGNRGPLIDAFRSRYGV